MFILFHKAVQYEIFICFEKWVWKYKVKTIDNLNFDLDD